MAKVNKVKIKIPKLSANDDPNFLIAVNGVNYLIPKGKEVEVPDFVKDEYERSEAAREAFYETVATMSTKDTKDGKE